jgi:hypothetical protein
MGITAKMLPQPRRGESGPLYFQFKEISHVEQLPDSIRQRKSLSSHLTLISLALSLLEWA